ncbi:MAG TPA: FAD-dependent oxidoreductase [Methylomirabilota bacterium]|nr:FAD-dependent oxidoreductase [Methylomirabilota bacterium]
MLIVGGGVIGCAVAYELAKEGLRVTLLERAGLCAGASGANGALIWPQAMHRGVALDLTLACARLFPTLGEELGADIEYRRTGGMVAIETEAQWAQMTEYVAGQPAVGLHAELLDGAEACRREPLLAPDLRGAVFAEHGGTINPFRLTLGYAHAARVRGATLVTGTEVLSLLRRGDRIAGVRTLTGDVESGVVILAGGAWSGPLAATANLRVPVTPRQGMVVVTEPAPFRLRHVLKPIKSDRDMWRFSQPWPPDAPGKPGYDPNLPPGKGMGMAQTVTGNLVIGSTSRFVGLDRSPTLAGIRHVLESARRIAPAIGQLRMLRTWAGFRPYTPDGLPLLGPAPGVDGLVLATGHDGSGIGMSPVSARLVAAAVTKADPPLPLEPFDPRRFADS